MTPGWAGTACFDGAMPAYVIADVRAVRDRDAARAWWESEEYAPLKDLRRDASDTNIILVEGAA